MPRYIANKRMPISCENCRKRKIACSGGRPPCNTCTKRGFASTCRFLKDSSIQEPRSPQSMSSSEHNLLDRIATLEQLLRENIESTTQTLRRMPDIQTFSSPSTSTNIPQTPTYSLSGRLVRYPSGHVRYMIRDDAFQELIQESMIDQASPGYVQSSDFPFSTGTIATKTQILELLPPLSYCDELKTIFMHVFSPLFHILHDPTFEEDYIAFRQNPAEVPIPFLALIFVVLAVAVTALDDDHHILSDLGRETTAGANVRIIAARFRDAAMRALSADSFLWRHNLRTLQTLVLLIYALSHAHGPAWSLLGTTLNIAIAIGCHVDPSKYDVSLVEAEERRRAWAALTMLYTIQDTCMGNLSPMNFQADIQPPADLDDDVLSRTQSLDQAQEIQASGTPSKMTYILYKFKLYLLASEICTFSACGVWQESSALVLDRKVAIEESIHKNRFSQLETLPLYHQAHYYILSSYTNHLYVILHRPCLRVAAIENGSPQSLGDSESVSINRLYQASQIILNNYEILHATQAFQPYKWYTYGLGSFHAFLASTTLATIIGDHSLKLRVDKHSATIQLRQCLHRFEKASERSDICAKAANILRKFFLRESHKVHQQRHCNSIGREEDDSFQRHADSGQNLPEGRPWNERRADWNRSSGDVFSTIQESHPDAQAIDVDGWSADLELQSVFTQISSQQWLSPSSFPWWRWSEGNVAI